MVSIVIGKNAESGAACSIVYRNGPQNEQYQDLEDENSQFSGPLVNAERGDIEVGGDQPYDPEIDSPSSWTTKSSTAQDRFCYGCRGPCYNFSKIKSPRAAFVTQAISNAILILLTLAGIVYGVLGMTGTVSLYENGRNDTSIGGLVVFGAVIGGSVSLILVNVSWWYRGNHNDNLHASIWCSCLSCCPTAQLASTLIVLLVGAILVPTYRDDIMAVLLIIFGIVLPLLVMVNLPMMFERHDEECQEGEDNSDANTLEVDAAGNIGTDVEIGLSPAKMNLKGERRFETLR